MAGSVTRQAEVAARQIYKLRETRMDILSGEADNMPPDGEAMKIVLQQLTDQEQALTALFVGEKHRKTTFHETRIVPDDDLDREVLFRFSEKLGLLDPDDLGGTPIYLSLHAINRAPALDPKEAEKKEKAMKGIIYNVPGKVVLADGTTHEGSITIVYESIEKKMGKGTGGILDLDAPAMGSAVTLTHNDANGKTEQKFKAADNITVYAGGKTYIGAKGSKDGVLTNAGGSGSINIGTRHPQFFEVRFTDGKGNYILEHPLDKDELYLKLKDRKEAIYLGDKAMLGTRSAKTRTKLTA